MTLTPELAATLLVKPNTVTVSERRSGCSQRLGSVISDRTTDEVVALRD
jgi:hypothetical protein